MNYEQLSPREWQMISAYLDGQLKDRERRVLETRLQSENTLRQGLEEMRRTRLLLRSAPKRRAPRNFTISRAVAEAARPARTPLWGAYPAFRLASALASILLVITFLGDFALGTSLRAATKVSTEQAAAPAAAAEMAPAQQQDTATGEPGQTMLMQADTPLAQPTETPGGLMMAAPLPTLNPTEEIIQRMTAAPPGMGGGPVPTPAEESRSMLAPTATPEPSPSPMPAPMLKAGAETAPYPAPEEAETFGRAGYPEPAASDALSNEAGVPAASLQRWFRPVEIALALIALLTGVGALLLRRR